MQNKGLIFIPDISGFTRFVNQVEIEHSRLIIQELLEILVDANDSWLEISEIEGDAILFYRFGEPPTLEKLYRQVEKMFCAFHSSLVAYERNRYCQCRSCSEAIGLTLKVITHYGEFTGYNVKQFSKLIGRDIIVAHQLLKNDINLHEYWLVTTPLTAEQQPPAGLTEWMKWNSSLKRTEHGDIQFLYTQLSPLKRQLRVEPLPPPDLAEKIKVTSVSAEFKTDPIHLFHAAGDFHHRSRWQAGVIRVEEIAHLLPRVGMRCRCVMENGETVIYASSYSYLPGNIKFSETDESNGDITCYAIEETGQNTSRLTIDFYIGKNIIRQIIFKLFRQSSALVTYKKSLLQLDQLLKTMSS